MTSPDHQLLKELSNGSEAAFEVLYIRYKEPAVGFCYSMLKNMDEAENIVHDVFVQFWEKRYQLGREIQFKAYLFASLRNRVFDHLKALKKNEMAVDQLFGLIETFQLATAEDPNEEKLRRLFDVIEELPEGRKNILKLRYLEGKSYEEIADKLNISTNTVKNQLIKARQYLRDNLDLSASYSIPVLAALINELLEKH